MIEAITLEHVRAILNYVSQESSITNRDCRRETGLGYDSSIKIFGALCSLGLLKKVGETSTTKYVLPTFEKPGSDKITFEHLAIVLDYVVTHGSISNRNCRDATGVTYNSSIRIFAALCVLGMIKKIGEAAGTRYIPVGHQTFGLSQPGYLHKTKWSRKS